MDGYIDPQMKATMDFHLDRKKNNSYQPGTMCHKQYESASLKCIDREIAERSQSLRFDNTIRGIA